MDENTQIVLFSSQILTEVRNKYPNTVKLLNYNANGTVKCLETNGILSTYLEEHQFDVTHSGSDNLIAWRDYRYAIMRYLDKLCYKICSTSDYAKLSSAREYLADYIRDEHYKKFKYWPKTGLTQSDHINLNIVAKYPYSGYLIVWACEGWITVTDEHLKQDKYTAKFSGSPTLKILMLDEIKTRELEESASNDFDEAKKTVDSYKGRLTWSNLRK
ncbi:hypothetical protein C1645_738442 [Glomus cerebriforme]|uniref:Uncharacterized protein n=1 Tax=Glomus cerebriforme TaxID=658196 RepID=A0A397SU45_9GLOM|nr:hypothetical protein C1645_738442 [Glomus cerebriforme]